MTGCIAGATRGSVGRQTTLIQRERESHGANKRSTLEGILSRLSDEALVTLYERAAAGVPEAALQDFLGTILTAQACADELIRRGKIHLLAR
jgi:hypothetical protein